MLSRHITKYIVRNLRNNTRITSKLDKEEESCESPVLPLSEEDLQSLIERDKNISFTDLHFQPKEESASIDKTSISHIDKPISKNYGINEKSKPKFRKLKDFLLKGPLTEAPTHENQFEKLSEVVTPFAKIPYQTQLKIKQGHAEDVLRELRKKLKAAGAPMSSVLGRLPCPIENIVASPDILAYRNKDEFSVRVGVDGDPKTVGYFYGNPNDPHMRCIPPDHLINIKDSHKLVVKHFQHYIRKSPYLTCLKFKEGGVWRNLVVRSNLKGEIMVTVIIYPGDNINQDSKDEIKASLKEYFFSGPGAECQISSLYLQASPYSKSAREVAPFELIDGQPYLEEECLGKLFRISPDSFFQTNTKAAELLYHSVQKVAELSPLTTLLDICCGTGPISVLLAPDCRGAIGIDSVSSAIEDAKINAKRNNVSNINYIPGKVENILPILAPDLEDCSDVIAVVNPARAGLHPSVIESIRSSPSIKKLIFVTCKPEGNALNNMVMLGSTQKPKRSKMSKEKAKSVRELGDPFALRYAIPLDLFPYTLHIEYVFLFERVDGYEGGEV